MPQLRVVPSIALAALFLLATVSPVLAGLPPLAASPSAHAPVPHVDGSSPAFGSPGTAAWDAYTVPDDQSLTGQLGLWSGSGEPSGGICWATSAANPDGKDIVYFKTMTGEARGTFDDSTSPATPTWTDASHVLLPEARYVFADPILHTDETTCRTWAGHMQLPSPCTTDMAFRDDDPAALPPANPVDGWTPIPALCQLSNSDHETIGSGPYSQDLPVPQAVQGTVYPHIVYYCAQILSAGVGVGVKQNSCAESYDGGLTWPVTEPSFDPTQGANFVFCDGIFGHLKVSNEGYAAVPYRQCGSGTAGLHLSRNNGLTWDTVSVPGIADSGHFDPSIAFSRVNPAGAASKLYFAQALPDGLYAAVSGDFGLTWTPTAKVSDAYTGPNGEKITHAEFPNTEAGDAGRAAVSFLGATDASGADSTVCPAANSLVWYMYVARTFDGGATWSVERASGDPVQVGGIWPSGGSSPCRNLLDFNDLDLGSDGRLVISFADGCLAPSCYDGASSSTSTAAQGTVIRQSSGCGLFAAKDAPGADCTSSAPTGSPELTVSAPADGATVASDSTVSGTVDRSAGTTGPALAASAGGPYAGHPGDLVSIAATGSGGTAPYACAWTGAGATFADAASCSTTVSYAATGSHDVHVAVTDAASGSASADGTVDITAVSTGPSCITDPAADTAAPDPAGLYDLTNVCAQRTGSSLVVSATTPGLSLDDTVGTVMSPVVTSVSVDSQADTWDVYRSAPNNGFIVWDNNAGAESAGTAASDGTTLTITLPLSETGEANAFAVTTSIGEGLIGLPLKAMDSAPDSGLHTLAAPAHLGLGAGTRASDPAGDSKMPGTDITGAWVHDETPATFQVSLAVADLPSAQATSVSLLGSPTGVATEYTVSFGYAESATNTVTYRVEAGNHLANVPEPGAPAADPHTYSLQVTGAGTTNFVTNLRALPGTWGGADGKTITWTVTKADMVVKTAPTGATDAGVMAGGNVPATGGTLSGFTEETATWVYAGVGVGPSATVWDTAGPDGSYTFGGGPSAPHAITDLVATPGSGRVALSWSAPATGGEAITGYTVAYGTTAGSHPVTQAASGTDAIVSGLTNGQAYFFTVTATDALGTGPASNEATATPTACPSGERVVVLEGAACLGGTAVATTAGSGPAAWSVDLTGLATGTHTLSIKWIDAGGAQLGATATRTVTVPDTTTTSTTTTSSTSGTGGGNGDTGSAGGSVNNVAPVVDAVTLDPSVAIISRDGAVNVTGAAHDDNGNVDVASVTVKVTGPEGASSFPAATLSNDGTDPTALAFAAHTPVTADTPTGSYQVDTFATDAAGAQSPVVTRTFTVLPPPKVEIAYTGTLSRLDFGSFDPGAVNVTSTNQFSVRNALHATEGFSFDMTDFTCTRGVIPVMGNANVNLGHLDDAGAFVVDSTVPYDANSATVSLGTLSEGSQVLVQMELLQVPKAIAGTCTASFGLYHA